MRFLKAAVLFGVAFVAAWVIIFTFIQSPFHQTVPAKLLWYQTPPYPIYYMLGAPIALRCGPPAQKRSIVFVQHHPLDLGATQIDADAPRRSHPLSRSTHAREGKCGHEERESTVSPVRYWRDRRASL